MVMKRAELELQIRSAPTAAELSTILSALFKYVGDKDCYVSSRDVASIVGVEDARSWGGNTRGHLPPRQEGERRGGGIP